MCTGVSGRREDNLIKEMSACESIRKVVVCLEFEVGIITKWVIEGLIVRMNTDFNGGPPRASPQPGGRRGGSRFPSERCEQQPGLVVENR